MFCSESLFSKKPSSLPRSIFSVTRIPKTGCDEIRYVDAQQSLHIVVFWRNHVFRVDVCENDGSLAPKSIDAIYAQLLAVEATARALAVGAPVGLVTTAERDDAAKFREQLLSDKLNAESIEVIETAMFVSETVFFCVFV